MAEITRAQVRRGMIMPLLVALFGVGVFFRIPGAENVRAVHMLALIAVGMGVGVALAHFKILLGMKKE